MAHLTPQPIDRALVLRITLLYLTSSVWRDVIVRASTFLHEVHAVIQASMGWEDRHLYEFRQGDRTYVMPDSERGPTCPNAQEVRLSDLGMTRGDLIDYTYDFGDGWDHRIEVLSEQELSASQRYPECLGGDGTCPPEDCGGPPGFEELKAALEDPSREGATELLDWLGGSHRLEPFNVERANERLTRTFGGR